LKVTRRFRGTPRLQFYGKKKISQTRNEQGAHSKQGQAEDKSFHIHAIKSFKSYMFNFVPFFGYFYL
jgi:hypothetical protein